MIGYIYLKGAYLVRKDYLNLIDKYLPCLSDEQLIHLCKYLESLVSDNLDEKAGGN